LANLKGGGYEEMGVAKVSLKAVPWGEVEARVRELDPRLAGLLSDVAKEIEQEAGSSEVFLARYPYGHEIVTNGQFRIPWPHERHEGDDLWQRCFERVCAAPGVDANGGLSIPLSVVLHNSVEVTFNVSASRFMANRSSNRMIPLRILREAETYGVFEVLDYLYHGEYEPSPWTVVSGCRSAYLMMLRKSRPIREELLTFLQDEGWNESEEDNWELLQAIARKSSPGWHAEVLMVPRVWFTGETFTRMRVRELVSRIAWKQSSHLRKVQIHETELEYAIHDCDPNMDYLQALHHLRHLISVGQGSATVFRPLRGDCEHLGPFTACQGFLHGLKNLTSYPVIFLPAYLNQFERIGYYSLTVPSLFGFVPESPRNSWVKDYLQPLSSLIKKTKFLEATSHGSIAWDQVRIYGELDGAPREGNLRHCRELCEDLGRELHDGNPPPMAISPRDRFLVACIKVVRTGDHLPDETVCAS
jgi:hypothetical protein